MLRRLNKNNDFPLRIIDPKDCTRTIVDPKEISETLADYWRNIGSNGKIQSSCINDIMRGQVDKLMNYNGDTTGLSSIEIHFDNVKEAISKLKNGKACGVDHIPNEFLKNGGTALITSLVDMFNMCKTLEVYPDQWFQGYIKTSNKKDLKIFCQIIVELGSHAMFISIHVNSRQSSCEAPKTGGPSIYFKKNLQFTEKTKTEYLDLIFGHI